ncbi:MAG TPA: hypothetical protein VN326_13190 [Casimicrobiaceae bacterium]|nr:hypothetical protein [Casimicrobiaceae bacterium]
MRAGEGRIAAELCAVEACLVTQLRAVETRHVAELRAVEAWLVAELCAVEARIAAEQKTREIDGRFSKSTLPKSGLGSGQAARHSFQTSLPARASTRKPAGAGASDLPSSSWRSANNTASTSWASAFLFSSPELIAEFLLAGWHCKSRWSQSKNALLALIRGG